MEQISDIWYSEDCRVPAVELEGWKIVLNRFRISVSNFGFEFRVGRRRFSGYQRAIIFRYLFSLLPPLSPEFSARFGVVLFVQNTQKSPIVGGGLSLGNVGVR